MSALGSHDVFLIPCTIISLITHAIFLCAIRYSNAQFPALLQPYIWQFGYADVATDINLSQRNFRPLSQPIFSM